MTRRIGLLHFHNYHLVRKDALAYFRKDNWPEDTAYVISGDLEICRCGYTHLKPYRAGFSEVEVSLPINGFAQSLREGPR